MAFGTRFYIPVIQFAKPLSQSSSFARNGAVLLDLNPDTYEVPIITNPIVRLDQDNTRTGSTTASNSITWAALRVNNYPTAGFGASAQVTCYSTTDPTFASLTSNHGTKAATAGGFGTSGYMLWVVSSVNRYWQWTFANFTTTPNISLAMVGVQFEIAHRWSWGSPNNGAWLNANSVGQDGTVFSRNLRTSRFRKMTRGYELLDQTEMEALDSAMSYSRGGHAPFLMTDDSVTDEAFFWMARFMQDELEQKGPAFGLYNLTLRIEEVPTIPLTGHLPGQPY